MRTKIMGVTLPVDISLDGEPTKFVIGDEMILMLEDSTWHGAKKIRAVVTRVRFVLPVNETEFEMHVEAERIDDNG